MRRIRGPLYKMQDAFPKNKQTPGLAAESLVIYDILKNQNP